MKTKTHQFLKGLISLSLLVVLAAPGRAYDITDRFSINGVGAGVYQYQWADDAADGDIGRGAALFQPEFSLKLTETDEISAVFGFAAGNGLNEVTGFSPAPWAADLEDDVKDINGRNRDYLLTLWYKHTFALGENQSLGVTGGIIDATAYIDENAFANDEYTQFMNDALVNSSVGFLPSYDIGGAVEWEFGNFDFTVLGMNIGENDDGNSYHYFGGQAACKLSTAMGDGNYRLIIGGTSEDFPDEAGDTEGLFGVTFSFDQEFGDVFGAWIRLGWQEDKAPVDYDALYSGGLNITGRWYNREADNIGLGYAYLKGKNGIDGSQVGEIYWRVVLNDYVAVTADLQYMKDEYDAEETADIDGWIAGVRMTVEF